MAIAVTTLLFSCNESTENGSDMQDTTTMTTMEAPASDPMPPSNGAMMKDGMMMMKDGKMMMMKDGQMMMMEQDMTLGNGTKVMMSGEMMHSDGKKHMLTEGMMVDAEGNMMNADGTMAPHN